MEMAEAARELGIVEEPVSLAASVYIAAQLPGELRIQKEVARAASQSEWLLRRSSREMSDIGGSGVMEKRNLCAVCKCLGYPR